MDGFTEEEDQDSLLKDESADDVQLIKAPSSLRAAVSLTLLIGIYVCAEMSFQPLQSQYIHSRVKEDHKNLSNTSYTSACKDNSSYSIHNELDAVQKESTRLLLYVLLCMYVPSVFVNFVIGAYSDFLGRKLIFLLPLLGCLANGISILSVIKWHLDLRFLFIGAVVEGLSGSTAAMLLASFSYTADSTNPRQSRTIAIAVVNALMALGAVAGQVITGYLISAFGFLYPALVIVISAVVDIFVLAFILPETLKKRQKPNWSLKQNIKKTFSFYTNKGTHNRRKEYTICIFAYFCAVFSAYDKSTVETLYQLGLPLCWDSMKIGYYNAIKIFLLGICSVTAIKVFHSCCKDEVLAILGMVSAAGSLVLEAFSGTDVMMYLVPVVASLSCTTSTIIRSIMSRMTSESEQGSVFASLAISDALTLVVSTTLFNTIYEQTLATAPGAVFLVIAVFSLIAIVLILMLLKSSHGAVLRYEDTHSEETE